MTLLPFSVILLYNTNENVNGKSKFTIE